MALAVAHGVRVAAAARWADVAFIYWQIRLPVRRQRHSIVDYFDQLSINRRLFYILMSNWLYFAVLFWGCKISGSVNCFRQIMESCICHVGLYSECVCLSTVMAKKLINHHHNWQWQQHKCWIFKTDETKTTMNECLSASEYNCGFALVV